MRLASLDGVLVLALDTASAATAVAVGDASGAASGSLAVLAERTEVASNRHGELLAPMISDLLSETDASPDDIGRIVVGVGPGPFTGLRVGLVTATAMGQALGIDVVGICSLDAVAHASADRPWQRGFAVLGDARRREVYWASYAEGRRLTEPAVARPADLSGLPPTVVGAGALLHRNSLPAGVDVDPDEPWPSAGAMLRLAADSSWLLPPRPLYLRRPDAQPPARLKVVTPI